MALDGREMFPFPVILNELNVASASTERLATPEDAPTSTAPPVIWEASMLPPEAIFTVPPFTIELAMVLVTTALTCKAAPLETTTVPTDGIAFE